MMVKYLNLFIYQGSDFERSVILTDPDTEDPLALDDLTFKGQIRKTPLSEGFYDLEIIKSVDIAGEITIKLGYDTSTIISSGRYVYDIFFTDEVNNRRIKVIEGIVEVIPQVTRTEEPEEV